jgi:hypothetical protein
MISNKIVVRLKDGTLKKGTTIDFSPNKKSFRLNLGDGETVTLNIDKLKAIFFVKDLEGNKDHEVTYTDIVPGGGRKVRIEFTDGEILIGYTQGYSPERPGFFVLPADTKCNNERIFVISPSIQRVTFL